MFTGFRKTSIALLTVLFVTVLVTPRAEAGKSASASADAKAKVSKSIKIDKVSDLDFGEGFTGDAALVLDPNAGEGAEFTVTGEKNRAFDISLPASVTLTTGDGAGADKQITVDNFTSNPSGSGHLGASGEKALRVGATRAALSETQESGDYSASFTVTVTYQ